MTPCEVELLEGFVRDELSPADRDRVTRHVLACAACARELRWLEAERRMFQRRAESLTPPPLRMAVLRRGAERRLPAGEGGLLWQGQLAQVSRAVMSAGLAVLAAFVLATWPGAPREGAGAPFEGSSCVSMEATPFCAPQEGPHELVAEVEDLFEACLLATPKMGPGGIELCW